MGDEKLFIGCKLITAIPMGDHMFRRTVRGNPIADNEENQPGYRVTYPDGYVSWSPKGVFENAYREVTDGERKIF